MNKTFDFLFLLNLGLQRFYPFQSIFLFYIYLSRREKYKILNPLS